MALLSVLFGRGLLSARPAAATEGAYYYATDEGLLYRDNGTTWDLQGAEGLIFQFSTTTADADPGAGILRFDSGTPASVTTIYVDDQGRASDADLSTVWANISGARVLITQHDDASKYLLGEVTAVADGTGYYKLTVTVEDSGTLIDDAAALSFVVLGGGGGSGGGTIQWWDSPTAHVQMLKYYSAGILNTDLGRAATLYSGSLDNAGIVGTGGVTELTVPCSSIYDNTPAAGGHRGVAYGGAAPQIRADNGHYCKWICRWPVATDQALIMGLGAPSSYDPGSIANLVQFRRDDGTDANWQAYSFKSGSTSQKTDTGVAYATTAWHIFELYLYNDGGTMTCKFWIDGVLVATHTTEVPIAATDNMIQHANAFFHIGGDTGTYDSIFFCSQMKWCIDGSGILSALGTAEL